MNQKANLSTVETILINTLGSILFSPKSDIEIMPGVFSPIFINLKLLISFPHSRLAISRQLSNIIDPQIDIVCGLESGGSYYASSVANLLQKPLLLLRKENKQYGDRSRIVGQLPSSGQTIAIVDDVLATGSTILKAKQLFSKFNCRIKAYTIFSYGHNSEISSHIGIDDITSLCYFNDLSSLAIRHHIFTPKDLDLLQKHIDKYKDFLKSKKS